MEKIIHHEQFQLDLEEAIKRGFNPTYNDHEMLIECTEENKEELSEFISRACALANYQAYPKSTYSINYKY